jgi:helix-turn-helix protein
MSSEERKLVDTSGDYMYAVRDGTPVDDPRWRSCRLVMTNKRLMLANGSGKQALPHTNIEVIDAEELPDGVDPAGATPMRIGDNVVLFDAANVSDFELEYCRATLHGTVILAKHPAVVGGVIQEDAGWQKTRFRLNDDEINLVFPGGGETRFAVDDVGTIETGQQTVMDESQTVLEVEHTDDDISVETHLAGEEFHATVLRVMLEESAKRNRADLDLSSTERRVIMALHSGVSPFDIPSFVGIDVERSEEIFDRLIELDVISIVRERTEVQLTTKGRRVASENMGQK